METYLTTNSVYPTKSTALIGASPPYLQVDYFDGTTYNGFTYTVDGALDGATYSVTAEPPSSNLGSASFTISTGSVLIKN